MKSRISLALAGFGLLALSACGTTHPAEAGSTTMSGPAPLDAALVTPAFGWVLTPDALLITRDGGATFEKATPPLPEAGQLRVEPGGRTWVAGDTLDATADQGRTWNRAQVTLAGTPTATTLATPIGSALPVTVVDGDQTSVELLTSNDQGRT